MRRIIFYYKHIANYCLTYNQLVIQIGAGYTGRSWLYRSELVIQIGAGYTGRSWLYRSELVIQVGAGYTDRSWLYRSELVIQIWAGYTGRSWLYRSELVIQVGAGYTGRSWLYRSELDACFALHMSFLVYTLLFSIAMSLNDRICFYKMAIFAVFSSVKKVTDCRSVRSSQRTATVHNLTHPSINLVR